MGTLDGKVAILAGCGRPKGMGEATALKLADEGARVVVGDICRPYERGLGELMDSMIGETLGKFEYLEVVARKIEEAGGKAKPFKVDISRKEEVDGLVSYTVEAFGRPDILVNAVGTGVGAGAFLEINENAWDKTFDVNMKGTFYLMRAVIPEMVKAGGGRIINVTSLGGLRGGKGYGAYDASKFSQTGMTQTAAAEFAPHNILINAVCPGWIATSMGDDEFNFMALEEGCTIEELKEKVRNAIPQRRFGTPEDVANVIYFLASPLGSYVTGQSICVTGGYDLADPISG